MTLPQHSASVIYENFRRVWLHWQFSSESIQHAKLTDYVRRLSPRDLELAVGDAHEDLRAMAWREMQLRQDAGTMARYRPGEVRAMDIIEQLKRDEGYERYLYTDTRGVPTVGYGFNLRDEGLAPDEAEYVLRCKVAQHRITLVNALPWVANLPDPQQGVLLNMVYNLGLAELLTFGTLLGFVKAGDYEAAAQDMLATKWATEVGVRAQRLALQMRTGEWQ